MMRRVLILVVLCAALGWVAGNAFSPAEIVHAAAEDGHLAADGRLGTQEEAYIIQKVSSGTVLVAANEQYLAQADLPAEVLDARRAGEQARQEAIDEVLSGRLPGGAKDGEWSQGGPFVPLDPSAYIVQPSERTANLPAVPPFPVSAAVNPIPLPVSAPAFGSPIFGPGNPYSPIRRGFIEKFDPQLPETPEPIPAPATWLLLILGFAGLAHRYRLVSRQFSGARGR